MNFNGHRKSKIAKILYLTTHIQEHPSVFREVEPVGDWIATAPEIEDHPSYFPLIIVVLEEVQDVVRYRFSAATERRKGIGDEQNLLLHDPGLVPITVQL